MKATIEAAGRVVIPKLLREELGLQPGLALEVHARDGALVIELLPTPVKLTRRGKRAVAVPEVRLPELTQKQVRTTLGASRR